MKTRIALLLLIVSLTEARGDAVDLMKRMGFKPAEIKSVQMEQKNAVKHSSDRTIKRLSSSR
jgi:hypothetical protein